MRGFIQECSEKAQCGTNTMLCLGKLLGFDKMRAALSLRLIGWAVISPRVLEVMGNW
jgi:hypothetical protein